jgi:hypothetical protein
VNRLQWLGLVYLDKRTLRPAIDIMAAFVPGVRPAAERINP